VDLLAGEAVSVSDVLGLSRSLRSPPRHVTHAFVGGLHAACSDVFDAVEGNPGALASGHHRQAQQVVEAQMRERAPVLPGRRASPCHHVSICSHAGTVTTNGLCSPCCSLLTALAPTVNRVARRGAPSGLYSPNKWQDA
jgi:hypothetical protein